MSDIIKELVRAKVAFQQRAILAAMGVRPEQVEREQCSTCGDHHEPDAVPFTCQTGDGV